MSGKQDKKTDDSLKVKKVPGSIQKSSQILKKARLHKTDLKSQIKNQKQVSDSSNLKTMFARSSMKSEQIVQANVHLTEKQEN